MSAPDGKRATLSSLNWHACPRLRKTVSWGLLVGCWLVFGIVRAQTPEEHASHHPATATSAAGTTPAPSEMAGMGDMMKGMMGGSPPKELYPSLMALPSFTTDQRKQVEQQADERMHAGSALLGNALDSLNAGVQANNYAAMQKATVQMREGVTQMESGIAARRALAEGRPPKEVALTWFQREMNLTTAVAPASGGPFGTTVFHLFTMALLAVFALAMLAMYFFKMRRAASLFGRIEGAKLSSPPGSSPPLPEGKPPSGETNAAPLTANWRGQLRVGSIITETPGVKTFRLLPATGDRLLPFTFVPGQFLNVAFSIGGARMNRSYSISSSPNSREFVDLTIKREPRGAVSRHIDDLLEIGELIEVGGPVGKFTFDGTEAESIVLISAGVGITPMVSISRYLSEIDWPGEVFFIYTCRTPADYILGKEVAVLQQRNPKLHVALTMTKAEGADWNGPRGRLTKEFLTKEIPDLAKRRIHVCGPPEMMEATKALLSDLGVPAEQVKSELFGATKPRTIPSKPNTPATGPLVTFSINNKSSKIRDGQTVLELSEELGIGIENSCRVGTCGLCKVRLTSGEVEQEVQDALDENDRKTGIILACQAIPKDKIAVEA